MSDYEIFRGDLVEFLFDMRKDDENIRYAFGEQVTAITQNAQKIEPVIFEFANGLETSQYDLVVACDGVTSRTRAVGLACDAKPVNCWAAYFSIKQNVLGDGKIGLAHSVVGGRFMSLGSDPSGVNRASMMAIYPRDDHDATEPFVARAQTGRRRAEGVYREALQRHWLGTDETINGMMESKDFYASEIVQVKVRGHHESRASSK